MSNKERMARFVVRLHRLTASEEITWQAHDPRNEQDTLSPEAIGLVTSSVYYSQVDDMRVRIYRRKRELPPTGILALIEGGGGVSRVECVLEFVNSDGFADAEYHSLPGLPALFDVVRRKTSGLDQKLAAFMERDEANAERHHG